MQKWSFAQKCLVGIGEVFEARKIAATVTGWDFTHRSFSVRVSLEKVTDRKVALGVVEDIALATGQSDKVGARRNGTSIEYSFVMPTRLWKVLNYEDVQPNVGVYESGEPFPFNVIDYPAVIVSGSPGSGKSNGITAILHAACTLNPPESLRVSVVDPHASLWVPTSGHLQHAVAVQPDQTQPVVDFFKSELERRGVAGERKVLSNPKDFPCHLLVVDEATSETVQSTEVLDIVQSLVAQGRKFNLNVLLGIQKSSEKALPGIFDLVQHRFVGYCTSARVSTQLSGRPDIGAQYLSGKGDFWYISPNRVERLLFGFFGGEAPSVTFGGETPNGGTLVELGAYLADIADEVDVEPGELATTALDLLAYMELRRLTRG